MANNSDTLARMVGAAICERRKTLGMTQEELAEKVGIGQQSLSRIEQGRTAPRFERLQMFADALNCRIVDLFSPPYSTAHSCAVSLAEMLEPLDKAKREFVYNHISQLVRFLQLPM